MVLGDPFFSPLSGVKTPCKCARNRANQSQPLVDHKAEMSIDAELRMAHTVSALVLADHELADLDLDVYR